MSKYGHILRVLENAAFRHEIDFHRFAAVPDALGRLATWRQTFRLSIVSLFVLTAFTFVSFAGAQSIYTEVYTFTTLAGSSSTGSADGVGNNARFNQPRGIAVDQSGNLYVADTDNNTVRKITAAGVVSTIAGVAGSSGGADGMNSAARFNNLDGTAVDSQGNIYVCDSGNDTIREIKSMGTNWVTSTIAGVAGSPGSSDGIGTNAQFNGPTGIAVDTAGNLYVTDSGNATIREITPAGANWVVITIAGSVGNFGSVNGVGTNALFSGPTGVAVDNAGNLYVTDEGNNAIREITQVGTNWVTGPVVGGFGYADGTNGDALFYGPDCISVDSAGNLYVGEFFNNTIRKITPVGFDWMVTTLAGSPGCLGCGADGTGANAQFYSPHGITVDGAGNLFVADTYNNTIRSITSGGVVSTLAGMYSGFGSVDGTGTSAQFDYPEAVAVDRTGNIYVADSQNYTVRKITSAGVVSTVAGLARNPGTNDGIGNNARFIFPSGVAVDGAGNVYVTDFYGLGGGSTIRMITPGSVVSTIATGLIEPVGIAVDGSTNLFVADEYNSEIYEYSPAGSYWNVSFVTGLIDEPAGVAVDHAGNVYVSDLGISAVHKITPDGANWVVTTIAGGSGVGSADGLGTDAQFYSPSGLAVDGAGNVYVADYNTELIRKITPIGTNWVVSTIGGLADARGGSDGVGSMARFAAPRGVALDTTGNVYVADADNNSIRRGVFLQYAAASPVSLIQPANNASLVVTLLPAGANGQWRFPWELAWRPSGTAATNLVPNVNYPVEFSPVPGYLTIPALITNFVAGGVTNFVTGQYYPTVDFVDTNTGGSLQVFFQINPPGGAGWRLLGDTNAFHPSGFATNLLPGNYLIEFAALSNFIQIPIESVQVSAGSPTVVQNIYQPSQPAPNGFLLPVPVPSGEISDVTDYPYGFNGQLETDVGYGSGVAVQANVVLTAAHLIFNDQTLSYVSQAWWYPQEESPQFVPEPQAAQGWLVLSGYAAQRTNDLLNGFYADESSPQSRNFDVAALYFGSPVAGGGYGGYLPSDATPNTWLTGSANKMLVGYPVDGSMFRASGVVPGQMYQIGPQPYQLNLDTDPVTDQQVYTAAWFLSYPGNSGGPFYVELNGNYYPAGVYLGTLFSGTTPYASAVRAIDSNVVNLITNAQAFVTTGTNNSGGGVVTISAAQNIASNPGGLEVTIAPPAALQAGGAWKLSTLSDAYYSTQNPSTLAVTSPGSIQVQFKQISGWNLPSNQSVTVSAGTVTPLTSFYTLALSWPSPAGITYGTALGSSQLDASAITSGTYGYSPSAGTVLAAGTHTLSVNFTPNDTTDYGSAVTTNTSLSISRANLTVTAANTNRLYGQVNPPFSGTTNGLQNGDTITATYSTSATASSPVGPYSIVPGLVNSNQPNYTVTLVNGTLTVTAAPLTVTAHNASRPYGEANPAFTGTISGLRSGDNVTANYNAPSVTTSSPPGIYSNSIVPTLNPTSPISLINNYQVALVPGTLTVTGSSAPVIQSAQTSGGTFTLSWSTTTGAVYQIQSTPSMVPAAWTNLGSNITATNSTMAASQPISTNARQFYRIVLLP